MPLMFLFILVNFVFQIFPLFIPEMHAGFMQYTAQIIPIYSAWFLSTVIWLLALDLILLSMLRRTMAYASSLHNNLDSL
jgi:hypothetical protein